MKSILIFLFIPFVVCQCFEFDGIENVNKSVVLSRRKRYLIFPDGSSFQLVFCVQTSALIPIGDIFLYGSTAALAWNLPSEPKFFHQIKALTGPLAQKRGDEATHHIYYTDEKGKIIAKVPYKRKKIINPAFAKRSVDGQQQTFKEKLKIKIDRAQMHEKQISREYLKKEHMETDSVEFHRRTRVGLYEKIESLLTAMGHDGRQCVLYKLCESAQESNKQGTFLQEMFRIIFTLPKGDTFDREYHSQYDHAHTLTEDCTTRYPGCENFNIEL